MNSIRWVSDGELKTWSRDFWMEMQEFSRDGVGPLDAARFFESWRPEAEAGEG